MTLRFVSLMGVLGLCLIAPSVGVHAQQAPPPQIQAHTQSARQELPAFRSRITLVPLDVRVLDRDGKPVTDLGRDDFTILENDNPQVIALFAASGLVPEAPPPSQAPNRSGLRQAPASEMAPQRGRTFLLIVGRGRIQEPYDGIGALIAFVRERLLPQDRVAIMAYNRITDFTTDHEQIAAVLKRFAERHERIDALLQQWETGLAPQFAKCPKCLPEFILPKIDDVFRFPGAIVSREMPQALGMEQDIYNGRERRYYDALLHGELAIGRESNLSAFVDEVASRRSELSGASSSAEYISGRIAVSQDKDKLLNGISEMRYFDGEKHIVFLAEQGIPFETRDEDQIVARAASDARIVLNTIVTGGISLPTGVGSLTSSTIYDGPIRTTVPVGASAPVALVPGQVMKNLAAETGGLSSVANYPREALAAVDEVTRFEYLLGYYPANAARDGRFREVKVKVNRPYVTVLVRGGYYDEDVIVPADRAAFVAHQRISSAGTTRDVVRDLSVSLKVSQAKSSNKAVPGDVMVEMRINPSRIGLTAADGRRTGAIEFRVYCGDSREKIVGQTQGVMRLSLTEASYARYVREGIPYTARVPVKATPKTVKVVIYDPASDLAGSMVAPVR
jgi:VWFA-related protein